MTVTTMLKINSQSCSVILPAALVAAPHILNLFTLGHLLLVEIRTSPNFFQAAAFFTIYVQGLIAPFEYILNAEELFNFGYFVSPLSP